MSKVIKIKNGLDIKLAGKASCEFTDNLQVSLFALKPTDFEGLTPKLEVKEGDKVKAGTALFSNKYKPEILFTSSVSGTVKEIVRGERRRILEVVILADDTLEYEKFEVSNPLELTRAKIKENILKAGLWPSFLQRPYAIIANPSDNPKAIFVSAFDSSPLAPDYEFILKEQFQDFQTGINALSKLTDGKVNLSIHIDKNNGGLLKKTKNVEVYEFAGPHPSGNVGVQINRINPINKGEVVWCLNPQDVAIIGRLFNKGIYDASKTIAITGSEILKPVYCRIINGAQVLPLLKDNLKEGELRFISGNVLTGQQISLSGYIGYYDSQITVIEEGNKPEFLGWAKPGINKYSMSRSFFSWLKPKKEFRLNSNLNGGLRPFVVTGELERVFPMDIYPMQLLKAIIIEDIDLMEQLGIYEVAEEDFALCEFVNTSKIEIQKLVRQGLNTMIKEFN
jgi:Na+-transporting NADH:ubiquinone oxidoreductase subunit A